MIHHDSLGLFHMPHKQVESNQHYFKKTICMYIYIHTIYIYTLYIYIIIYLYYIILYNILFYFIILYVFMKAHTHIHIYIYIYILYNTDWYGISCIDKATVWLQEGQLAEISRRGSRGMRHDFLEDFTGIKEELYGSVSKPCTPVVHIKIAGICGCSSP